MIQKRDILVFLNYVNKNKIKTFNRMIFIVPGADINFRVLKNSHWVKWDYSNLFCSVVGKVSILIIIYT